MKRLLLVLWLLAITPAFAMNAESALKQAQASTVVTGTVTVKPDGSVVAYTIDHPEELPPQVLALIQGQVPGWKFIVPETVVSHDEMIKDSMRLRIVATPSGKDAYQLSIVGRAFDAIAANMAIQKNAQDIKRAQPRYPAAALRKLISGTVYLVLKVGRDGKVEDAIAQQVNLRSYGTPGEMEAARRLLADASLDAARQWTYNVPTEGLQANQPYWYARVPVNFEIEGRMPRYGQWDVYLPGPVQRVPWPDPQGVLASNIDAIADGQVAMLGRDSLRLKTPSGGS